MYLTAQRVRSGEGTEGVNAFCHLHGPYEWFGAPPSGIGTGELVNSSLSVVPGGNRVRSYVDIIVPDDAMAAEITATVAPFVEGSIGRPLPWELTHGRCTLRFGLDRGLETRWADELSELIAAALAVRSPY